MDQTSDAPIRSTTLSNGVIVTRYSDRIDVALPDGTDVDVPLDFAEATFASTAAKLSINRRFPTFRRQQGHGGAPVDMESRPDPFQFDGGVYPAPGQTITAADYAELVTHPFYGTDFTLIERIPVPEPGGAVFGAPASAADLSADALVAELNRRAAAGDPVASAFLQAQGTLDDDPDVPLFDDEDSDDEDSDDETPAETPAQAPAQTLAGIGAPEPPSDPVTGIDRITRGNVGEAAEVLLTYAREIGDALTVQDLQTRNGRGLSLERVRTEAERLGVAFTTLS